MSQNIEDTVEVLKAENLELKLDAIRKQFNLFRTDTQTHLNLILEQTSKTNGSVARAMERIAELERHDTKTKLNELKEMVLTYQKELNFWRLISTNKFIRWLIYFAFATLFIEGAFGVSFIEILKMIPIWKI
jgi:hypothetical protein